MATLRAKSFEVGIPMPIAIKKAGENVEGKFGDQVAFATSGGTLYLDPEPASVIEGDMRRLGIQYGETFSLTRAQTGGFIVRRAGDSGGNNNGRLPAASAPSRAPAATTASQSINNNHYYNPPAPEAAAAVSTTVATPPEGMTAATQCLMSAMCSAIDAAIETQAYAARKGLGVTFSEESIRAMGLSIYINVCKGGR